MVLCAVPYNGKAVTQLDKLIQRIRARPPEASFSDVRRLLESYGWVLKRQTGSHAYFTKPGERTQTVPLVRGRTVKRYILDQIIDRLGLDE
jgi:predicted RNA binding protein YcfA (HicA-like mRNA interferase family)